MNDEIRLQLQALLKAYNIQKPFKDLSAQWQMFLLTLAGLSPDEQGFFLENVLSPFFEIEVRDKGDNAVLIGALFVLSITKLFNNDILNGILDLKTKTTFEDYYKTVQKDWEKQVVKLYNAGNIENLSSYMVKQLNGIQASLRTEIMNELRQSVQDTEDPNSRYRIVGRANADDLCMQAQRETANGVTWSDIIDIVPVHPNCVCFFERLELE